MMTKTNSRRIAFAMAAVMFAMFGGCSDRAVGPQPHGSLAFTLKPTEPMAGGAATRAQATIIPLTALGAEIVVIELTITEGTVEGRAEAIPNGRALVIIEVWDETGALIMQGTKTVLVAPLITRDIEIALSAPPTQIDNDIVHLHFDHAHACIDSLTLKTGSGSDLLDQGPNIEMGQYGLGGLARLENFTQLVSYLDYGDSVVLSYANQAAYGTKTFHLRWSVIRDFEMTMEFFVVESLSVILGNSWSPGGDNVIGDGDSLAVRTSSVEADIYPVRYDTSTVELYSGLALSAAWFTGDQEEVMGYRFPAMRYIRCNHGARAEGPLINLWDGYHRIDFAVKSSREAFVVWAVGGLPQ